MLNLIQKGKALIQKIWGSMKSKWQELGPFGLAKIAIGLIVICGLIWAVSSRVISGYNGKIDDFSKDIAAKTQQIAILEEENKALKQQVLKLQDERNSLVMENDKIKKEASNNAYKKVKALKTTTDIVDYYNTVYRPSVVQRNSQRK